MKLTKRQLRRIIKEEKAKLLKEADHGGGWDGVHSSKHGCQSSMELMHLISSALEDAGCKLDQETWGYIRYGLDELESEAYQMGMDDGQEGHLT